MHEDCKHISPKGSCMKGASSTGRCMEYCSYFERKKQMFHKGDIVQAKKEWLAPHETQESTKGIVVDYNPDNDYLQVGVLNPQDYAFPPILNARGCYYEVVKEV